MSATTEIVEIPTFQTVEQLMDYLLEKFMFMYAAGGIILLTNNDLRVLLEMLQKFMNSPARSKNLTATDHYKEEKVK